MKWPTHGSNPTYLYHASGVKTPDRIIDFSVNTNPFGPPAIIKEKWPSWFQAITDYPDPNVTKLHHLISRKVGVSENQILIGNGAAELIQIIGQWLRGKKVLIIQPAFYEYEQACRAYDCQIDYFGLTEGDWSLPLQEIGPLLKAYDAVFLCTPNNPTGVVFERKDIIQLIDQCHAHACTLIIDEAFYDFADDTTSYSKYVTNESNIILLRSLTKMYAVAGLRIGYMLASEAIIKQLAKFKPHWSVNALAMLAAETGLLDDPFVQMTRKKIHENRNEIFEFLNLYQYEYSPSKVNFYLLKDPRLQDQKPLLEFLLQKGIVLRHTYNFPSLEGRWLRVAIKKKEENAILLEALRQWRNQP
ncbi:threonine-phosphate decarboxylase [Oikeobacillus pervagus]|uniref:threonine-phosphate decarboxylase n=1 Tax=Oikeobacillus pervagus TaxID=1325931 RepID=A0AAJ1T167_9BACI|nr:threonine-phosphate decarboxylase CobD [Oikeobacillus pervagus]MDQ0216419.1 threonine-phosphate decarboxylase [Oikeobacillus pervagus]